MHAAPPKPSRIVNRFQDTGPALVLSEVFPPRTGGSGRWFWETYRRLPREEYVIAAGACPEAEDFDRTHDLRVHRLPLTLPAWGIRSFQGLKGYWRALRGLRKLIRTHNVSMVHCGRCLPEGVMCLALKWRMKLPYLCYIHGEDVTTAKYSREHTWLVRHVLDKAEMLIANSQNTRQILLQEWGLSADKVRVLHPGVDTRYFVPAERKATVREELGWGERPVLLTVGRLQKRKGHDTLIRALSKIRQEIPDILYAIVGDGEERATLASLVQSEGLSGHVNFMDEMADADLLRCYQQCDVFVLPNRQEGKDIEGFGIVLLEAQACGKPVVAGASGGTAETMRIPETGEVVNCDGPELLADRLINLLGDKTRRERMGQAAREWIVDRFDWSVLCREAQEIFQRYKPQLLSGAATVPA